MPTKPKPKAKPFLPVRVPAEMVDRIDAVRPEYSSREAFVRYLLNMALEIEEKSNGGDA